MDELIEDELDMGPVDAYMFRRMKEAEMGTVSITVFVDADPKRRNFVWSFCEDAASSARGVRYEIQ